MAKIDKSADKCTHCGGTKHCPNYPSLCSICRTMTSHCGICRGTGIKKS
jgi:hypothetical protein